ncbi:MAG: nucleotidyltransferase [Candidatus Omnitrophota bacterium]|nr:MAG: nucleotidyltransferase [Candidatus Omnitrophota bacterium]
MPLDLSNLKKAIISLEEIVARSQDKAFMDAQDAITRNAIRAGVIQHFEFAFELCWKFMQRWIRSNLSPDDAVFPRTRKDLFRLSARHGLIAEPIAWFAYGDARNITSHTYDEKTADSVYEVAVKFVQDAKFFLEQLERFND